MISPALFFTFIILTLAGLNSFTEAYTAYFSAGSTGAEAPDAALFYAIYLFRQAFEFFNLGLRLGDGLAALRDLDGDHARAGDRQPPLRLLPGRPAMSARAGHVRD